MNNDEKIESILVKNFNNETIDLLAKYANENLVLLFYNNACLGCTGRAIPLAHQFQQDYKEIRVIAIHSNFGARKTTEQDIKSIFTVTELPFPIYLDENYEIYDTFKCEGTPHWLLITKQGLLHRSIFGSQSGAQNRLYYAIESLIDKN
jgi:peroxiredoxin